MVTSTDNTLDEYWLDDALFHDETFTAASALTFPKAMILGRITATGFVTFYASGASDGTEIPIGVLAAEHVAAGAGDVLLRMAIRGTIREDKLLVWTAGSPVVPTLVERELLRDKGIYTQSDRELGAFDNS